MIFEMQDVLKFIGAVALLLYLTWRARRGPVPPKYKGDLAQWRHEIRTILMLIACAFVVFPAIYQWLVVGSDRGEASMAVDLGFTAMSLAIVPISLFLRGFIPRT